LKLFCELYHVLTVTILFHPIELIILRTNLQAVETKYQGPLLV